MNSDVAFGGGRTHPVCQDYGLAGRLAGGAPGSWAVVCDGCSSEPHTDVGARLLAHAAARQIGDLAELGVYHHGHAQEWVKSCVRTAELVAEGLRLPAGALCATLLAVYTDPAGNYRVLVAGDGVVAARNRHTGEITVQRYQFKNEMPAYPYYLTSRRRLEFFTKQAGVDCLSARVAVLDPDPTGPARWLDQHMLFDCYPYTSTYEAARYDAVAVLTDGADAVRRRCADGLGEEAVPLAEAVRDLVGFKGLRGAFVQRRFKRAVKDVHDRGGWLGDDLAVGAVTAEYFDPAPDEEPDEEADKRDEPGGGAT